MNLLGTCKAAQNQDFRARVMAAIVLVSSDIIHDDALDDGEPSKINAHGVLNNPEHHPWISQLVWRTAANSAIAGLVEEDGTVPSTDADIVYVVTGAWHDIFPPLLPAPDAAGV